MRQLVLVVGAGGQLGEAMTDGLGARHEVVAKSHTDLDVTAGASVDTTVAALCPDVIVNCSAYTNVDAAEGAPTTALAVNAWAVRSLARAAAGIDATLVHFSTDFVFDGDASHPYTETDPPNPRSTYAMSKLLGEWFAAETPRHYVLRVESLFGGPRGKSSVDALRNGILAGRPVRAFADRTVSPTYVEDAVRVTLELLDRRASYGLYHCVNSGFGTWLDVARELASICDRPDASIEPIAMAQAALVAKRPRFAALSNAKLLEAGIALPTWQDALARYGAPPAELD